MNYSSKNRKMMDVILHVIVNYIAEHGYPPTIREIGKLSQIKSTSSVYNYLQQMFLCGMIESDAPIGSGSSRAIRVPNYKFVKETR